MVFSRKRHARRGADEKSAKYQKRRRSVLEPLEDRRLLAVRITEVPVNFPGIPATEKLVLEEFQLNGAPVRDEEIDVSLGSDGKLLVRDLVDNTQSFDLGFPSDYLWIEFHGGSGNDYFNNNTVVPSFIYGNAGDDRLIGSNSFDVIEGGDGNDELIGNEGNDKLWGGNGVDFLVGGHGYDILFGGTDQPTNGEVDTLHGGASGDFNAYEADRILLHQPFTIVENAPMPVDIVTDQTPEDAVIRFTDTANGLQEFDVTWAPNNWTDEEIERMEAIFADLYSATGDNDLLKWNQTLDLEFIRHGEPNESSDTAGWNYRNSGRMVIPKDSFDDSKWFEQIIVHEIGHNWDAPNENPFADEFTAISGWETSVSTATSTYSQWKNPFIADEPHIEANRFDDEFPWYFDQDATFIREYGATGPREDFATYFSHHFLGDDFQGGEWYSVGNVLGLTDVDAHKTVNIQRLMNWLAADPWKTTLSDLDPTNAPTAIDDVGNTPTLRWNNLAGNIGYALWIMDVSTGKIEHKINLAANTDEYTFPPEQALADGYYRYWVLTYEADGRAGTWSDGKTVRVVSPAGKVTTLTPSGTVLADDVVFSWQEDPQADYYELEVEVNHPTLGWTRILQNHGGQYHDGTFWAAPPGAPAGEYRFRVRAFDLGGVPGQWSDHRAFMVEGAPPITVNHLVDVVADDGNCTLREALMVLQTDQSSGSTSGECVADSRSRIIEFLPGLSGTYQLTHSDGVLPAIVDPNVVINGPGPDQITIDGLDSHRILDVVGSNSVATETRISGLTFTRGRFSNGGAIKKDHGVLFLDNVDFINNTANFGNGGAIDGSELVISNSRFIGNTATGQGGAIAGSHMVISDSQFIDNMAGGSGGAMADGGDSQITDSYFEGNKGSFGGAIHFGFGSGIGSLLVEGSTFYNNEAENSAGAINAWGADVFIERSTLSNNTAGTEGGAIATRANIIEVVASTIVNNRAADGGGIHFGDPLSGSEEHFFILDSLVALNTATDSGPDVTQGRFISAPLIYQSLIGNTTDIDRADIGDVMFRNVLNVTDPGIGPLEANGFSVPTHSLLPDSPARDQIPTEEALSQTDQRGVARPIGSRVDIGAFEADPPRYVSVSVGTPTVMEDGATKLVFTFSRTGDLTAPATVPFSVSGNGTFGSDYQQTGAANFSASSGSVVFPAGLAAVNVTVDPTADTQVESDETVILTLDSGGSLFVGAASTATGTIANDDSVLPTVSISVLPSSRAENSGQNLVYSVTRTGDTSESLTVNYTVSGTATSGTDYAGAGSSVTIAAGQSSASVTIMPTADSTVEVDETVILTITPDAGYELGTGLAATGTILNDDIANPHQGALDVNDDGTANPFQDGVLIVRYMLGQRGPNLEDSRLIPTDAMRTTSDQIVLHLGPLGTVLDANGDGTVNPFQDGVLIVRYLLGQRGPNLEDSRLIPAGSTLTTSDQIVEYLDTLMPASSGNAAAAFGRPQAIPAIEVSVSKPSLAMDVNGDQTIDLADAKRVLETVEMVELSSAGDVNRDGMISSVDALNIINHVAKQSAAPALMAMRSVAQEDETVAEPNISLATMEPKPVASPVLLSTFERQSAVDAAINDLLDEDEETAVKDSDTPRDGISLLGAAH